MLGALWMGLPETLLAETGDEWTINALEEFMASDTLQEMSQLFTFGREPGLGRWLAAPMHDIVRERLESLPNSPLSKVQLNQLLVVSKAASISDGLFTYYWRTAPEHTYDVKALDGFDPKWIETGDHVISSLAGC